MNSVTENVQVKWAAGTKEQKGFLIRLPVKEQKSASIDLQPVAKHPNSRPGHRESYTMDAKIYQNMSPKFVRRQTAPSVKSAQSDHTYHSVGSAKSTSTTKSLNRRTTFIQNVSNDTPASKLNLSFGTSDTRRFSRHNLKLIDGDLFDGDIKCSLPAKYEKAETETPENGCQEKAEFVPFLQPEHTNISIISALPDPQTKPMKHSHKLVRMLSTLGMKARHKAQIVIGRSHIEADGIRLVPPAMPPVSNTVTLHATEARARTIDTSVHHARLQSLHFPSFDVESMLDKLRYE